MPHFFETIQAPDYGPKLIPELLKLRPNIFLVMMRLKNKNIVVYESNIVNGKLDSKNPVKGYWLNIEESYRASRRNKGIKHDFENFNFFENKFIWGFTTKSVGTNSKSVEFKFKADNHPFRLVVASCDTKARLFTCFKEVKYMVRSGFASATENMSIRLKDNLKELTFNGMNLKTKKIEQFRFK